MMKTMKRINKKLAAILLAMLMLVGALASCSGKNEAEEAEAAEETIAADTTETAEEETETVTESAVVDVEEFVEMKTCTLETSDTSLFVEGKNPYYDKASNTIVFVLSDPVTISEDDKIYIGLAGEDAFNVSGHYDLTSYPQFSTEDGTMGVAVTADEPIAAGAYACVLNFGSNQVSFVISID